MDGKKTSFRNDLLLILSALVLAGIALLFLLLFRKESTHVSVICDGEVIGQYTLTEDAEIPIRTETGYNLLVIRDGCAEITEANCRDHICVHRGAIRYDGETIVCLPNRLVIRVERQASAPVDGSVR